MDWEKKYENNEIINDNELMLQDRIAKIKSIIEKYGEENFAISFSGGKDSRVLSVLTDIALPNNKIPRVYINTGIEYKNMVDFVKRLKEKDERITIISPSKNIKQTLEEYGYPFKSKDHSMYVSIYQNSGINSKTVQRYLNPEEKRKTFGCPKKLRYQFTDEFNIKLSRKCCDKLKKEPYELWMKQNNKTSSILGTRKAKGGSRANTKCTVFNKIGKLKKFNPLAPITDEWEEWFIKTYNIELCELYYEPYNFKRTGCKGCPFNSKLRQDLELMKELLPNEYRQCENIWKPIYEEYRRINYRLKGENK